MRKFSWTARDKAGATQRGFQDAADAGQIAAQLISRGLVPVRIEAQAGGAAATVGAGAGAARGAGGAPAGRVGSLTAAWQSLQQRLHHRAPSDEAVTLSIRELAAMLKAGIPILRSLRLVADTCDSPALRVAFEHLIADLDSGRSLAGAMEREVARGGPFHPYDVAMVRVGEETGRLSGALLDLHRHREFMRATREQVMGALRYPAFVIATCLVAMVVVNLLVIPAFAQVFAGLKTELPLLTRVLLGFSAATKLLWPYALVGAAAGAWLWRRWVATPAGRLAWDRLLLRVPLVGPVVYRIVMARFANSLAGGLSAGLTVTQALRITGMTLGNAHVARAIERIEASVERGESLSVAARGAGVFPPALLQMLSIGEESGTLDELLSELGQHYHHEVEMAVRRLSATMEPLLIVVLGLGVLVLALGIFMPMWDLGRASMK